MLGWEMKTAIFVAFIMVGFAASVGAAMTNPGFETGDLSGWTTFGSGWRTGGGGDANSGAYGAVNDVLPTDGDTYRGLFQSVSVTAGHYYTGGVHIRGISINTSESWFELQFLNGANAVIEQHSSAHTTSDQGYLFAGIGLVTAPVGAVSASIRAITYMPSAPGDADFHTFDDFSFDEVVPPDSGLSNEGFENDYIGWSTFGQGWRIGFGSDANSGSKGAVNDVLSSDVDTYRGVFQNVPVQAGFPYRASAQFKGVSLGSSESWLEIQWFSSGGGLLSGDASPHVVADQPFTLTELNMLVAPVGAVTASVRAIVYMPSVPGDADFHIIDDFDFGLVQTAVSGSLSVASIALNSGTLVGASGGSGDGDYEFRQQGGSGSVNFGLSGNPRNVTGTAVGTAVIQVRRLGNQHYAATTWVTVGTLTVNKASPTVSTWPTAVAIAEGQMLSASSLLGGTASVPGSFSFVNPTLKPTQGMASQSVRFTPSDTNSYLAVVGAVSVTVNAPVASGLTNPGFESDFASWSTFGQGWRIGMGGDANSGGRGAVNDVLPGDGDSYRGVFQEVPVSAGASYRAGLYIKCVLLESSKSWLEIQWLDGANGVVAQDSTAPVTVDQNFTAIELNNLVAPPGSVRASVRSIVQMESAPSDADFHIVDDFNFGLRQATVSGTLGSSSISFTQTTTVTASGGSGSGTYEFRQNGGSGAVSFSGTGSMRTITPVTTGTAILQVRRIGNSSYADSTWVSAGTLAISKASPCVTAWPSASDVYEGQSLGDSVLSGGSAAVGGVFAFVTPTATPDEGTASHGVRFTPTDTVNYIEVDGTVSVTVHLPPDSSLINPGFEDGWSGWSMFGQGWRTSGGGDARSGSAGAVNDVQSGDWDAYRGVYQVVPVVAGFSYHAGVYIRTVSVGTSESWLEIQWYDSGSGLISQQTSGHVTSDQGFSLVKLNNLVAPPGAVTASFRLIVYMPTVPGEADFHIFDDAYFVRSNEPASIMDFQENTLSFEATPGVVYRVLYTDGTDPTSASWLQQATTESSSGSATIGVTESPRRYFQIVPDGGSASSDERDIWGVIKFTVTPGYTMMSPPLQGNRDLHGALGAMLAESLTGDNNGTADRILVRSGSGWREFYLHGTGIWYEDGSPVDYTLQEGQGFFVYRSGATSTSVRFSGPVGNRSASPSNITIQTGWNIVGPSQGKNRSFAQVVAGATGAYAGWDDTTADLIVVDEGIQGWRRIMRYQGGGWYDLKSGTFSPSITVEPGDAVYYYRQNSAGSTSMSF